MANKELGQYPAILTSHMVNNPYLLYGKVNPSVLIGSFSVGILPHGPRSKPCIFFVFKSRQINLQLKLLKENM